MRRATATFIVLVLTLPLPPAASASGGEVHVTALGTSFAPSVVQASLLDDVVWTNAEPAGGERHTVTATSGEWTVNEELVPGETFTFSFPAEGSYAYRCLRHAGMTGEVVVAKGFDPAITSALGSPTPDASGAVPVTGFVNFTGTATSTSDPVERVRLRYASYVPVVRTISTAAAGTQDWVTTPQTVTRYDTVTWSVPASNPSDHTVTLLSAPAGVDLTLDETLSPGDTFSMTFPLEGVYKYRCRLHGTLPSAERTITVVDAFPAANFGDWQEADVDAGTWGIEQDFNAMPQGSWRRYEIRAESARAFQEDTTTFLVRAEHAPFDVRLWRRVMVDDDGVAATPEVETLVAIPDDGSAILAGDVAIVVQVSHPLWSPGSVTLRAPGADTLYGNPSTQAAVTPTQLSRRVGTDLFTLQASTTPGRYFPLGAWRTTNLVDGTWSGVSVVVTPPAYAAGSGMGLTKALTVQTDNRPDITLSPTGEADFFDRGVVAGTIELAGVANHGSPIAAVQWATGPCSTARLNSASWTNAVLAPGGTTTRSWSAAIDTVPFQNGETCLHFRATPEGTSDGAPDRLRVRVDVQNPVWRDLRLVSVAPQAAGPAQLNGLNGGVPVTARVAYTGNVPITPSTVDYRLEYFDGTSWIDTGAAWGDPAAYPHGVETDVAVTWPRAATATTVFLGSWPIRVTVDAPGTIAETFEGNNVVESTATWVDARLPATILSPARATAAQAALGQCATDQDGVEDNTNPDAEAACDAIATVHQTRLRAVAAQQALVACAQDTDATEDNENVDAEPACAALATARGAAAGAQATAAEAQGCVDDPAHEPPEEDAAAGAFCTALATARATVDAANATAAAVDVASCLDEEVEDADVCAVLGTPATVTDCAAADGADPEGLEGACAALAEAGATPGVAVACLDADDDNDGDLCALLDVAGLAEACLGGDGPEGTADACAAFGVVAACLDPEVADPEGLGDVCAVLFPLAEAIVACTEGESDSEAGTFACGLVDGVLDAVSDGDEAAPALPRFVLP